MILQAWDNRTGAFDSAGFYSNRIIVPWPHRLRTATAYFQHIVLTGTVELKLRFVDVNAATGGTQIGLKMEKDDLDDPDTIANTMTEHVFKLDGYEKLAAPPDRVYFLSGTATDTADRLDSPILVLDLELI